LSSRATARQTCGRRRNPIEKLPYVDFVAETDELALDAQKTLDRDLRAALRNARPRA
jgi:hypothetical protein